jgi:hypothetical protein
MKHLSTISAIARRGAAGIAATAAGLITLTAAFAAGSPGTALAADTMQDSGSARAGAAVPACIAGDLGAWVAVTQGNGAAGSIFYPLQFTNLSAHACTMYGFPGVSAVDRNGNQLGSPAGWDPVIPARSVVLAPGTTAHTLLQWSDAAVTTAPGCYPTFSTFELRVYPPGQYSATYAAFGLEACSHPGPVYMSVEPILPGVGTING